MLPKYADMAKLKTSYREHRELGDVAWLRDYDQALERARCEDKPVLLLFQEVPGCSTCVNFGHDVLSHPLMVEIIAQHFVPLAIFNNHSGADAEVLRRFGEAAWNNPVVHFLAPDGAAVVPRLANRYDPIGLHAKIGQVLAARDIVAPAYFGMLGHDLAIEVGLAEQVTYTTPCFWSGETSLAQHPAVISTDAGWIGGEEVVAVHFDPRLSKRDALDAYARNEGFAPLASKGFRLDREPQYYLRKHALRYLPLSAAQRTAINLALPYRQEAGALLSPQQAAWLGDSRLEALSNDEIYHEDIRKSWPKLERALGCTKPERAR